MTDTRGGLGASQTDSNPGHTIPKAAVLPSPLGLAKNHPTDPRSPPAPLLSVQNDKPPSPVNTQLNRTVLDCTCTLDHSTQNAHALSRGVSHTLFQHHAADVTWSCKVCTTKSIYADTGRVACRQYPKQLTGIARPIRRHNQPSRIKQKGWHIECSARLHTATQCTLHACG